MSAPLENLESTRFTNVWEIPGTFVIHQPLPVFVIKSVFHVEVIARLVHLTHTTMTSVQTLYDHVSVNILHQIEPFESMAEAIVLPSARVPRSSDIVVSPSSRIREKSENTIVIVQPGGVLMISHALSTSPVDVVH